MRKHYLLPCLLVGSFYFSQETPEQEASKVQQEIEQINLIAKKKIIEQKVDRLVFNVENSISAVGGNALEALQKTPSVRVQSEAIKLLGKESVRVMINGRIVELSGSKLNNYLESIASDDIKKIEVITTPPAKYEAEGNSGLINIVLKKGVQNSWSNTVRSAYTQASFPAFGLGNSFNYQKNKWSVNASLDGKKGNEKSLMSYEIFFPNARNVSQMESKNSKDYYSGRLGVDYAISEKSSIGGILMLSESFPDTKDSQEINIFDSRNTPFAQILTKGKTTETDKNLSANLHYTTAIDSLGKKLSIDLDYFKYKENTDRIFSSTSSLGDVANVNNVGSQVIDNYSFKVDMQHPMKWAMLSYGGKLSFSKTQSGVRYYDLLYTPPVLDVNQSNDFDYQENTQALYLDATKTFGEKWTVKLGLRYENTQTESFSRTYNEKFANHYGKLFPTAYVLYLMNESNFLNINYSRRISRPGFWELNPFRWYISSNSYSEGNPFLQPSFNHNISLTHGFKQKLFSTLAMQIIDDGFGQVPSVNATENQQIYTRENYYNGYGIGVVENYVTKPFKWWESSNQVFFFYSEAKVKSPFREQLPVQNGINSGIITSNSFVFNKKKTFLGELNMNYTFPNRAIIYRNSASYSVDIAVKYLMLDKKLVASFSVNDLFKTSNPDMTVFSNNIKQIYNNYSDNRYFRLSLSYTFGNNKISVSERNFGNEEEQGRSK